MLELDDCTSAAASAPAARGGIGAAGSRLHRRRLVEQLPAAALGGPRQAEHPEDRRGRRRHVHRCRREPEQRAAATDIDTLISKGAKVLIVLAQDTRPSFRRSQKAKDAGIPVIAYDRLIEDPSVLYITFDNVGVGKAEADAVIAKVPKGNYVLIKGDPGDPNAKTFLPSGWDQAGLKDKVASGDIKILNGPDGTFTDAWKTEKAQTNMEAIIDKAVADGNKIDAILAENDSTALGVVGALTAKNYGFPPLSGQDGDPANLNNVALGKQYVDVWKNANELGKAAGAAALALCAGGDMASLKLPDGLDRPEGRAGGRPHRPALHDPGGNTVKSFILQPTPLTADNLQLAIDGEPDHQGRPVQGRRRRRPARPPASSGLRPLDLAIDLRPRGNPGAQVALAPATRRGPSWRTWRTRHRFRVRPSRPPRPRSAVCSRRRRSISACSACSSPSALILRRPSTS